MITGCLAGAVRAVGLEVVGLGKGRIGLFQAAIHLVGRYVQKAKATFGLALQAIPVGARGFQQAQGSHHIGLDEVFRAMDRAIHMAFGRKVHDGAGLVFGQQLVQQCTIADITLHEDVAFIALHAVQIVQIACVGELIQIDHGLLGAIEPVQHKIRADKAGASGDENHGQ